MSPLCTDVCRNISCLLNLAYLSQGPRHDNPALFFSLVFRMVLLPFAKDEGGQNHPLYVLLKLQYLRQVITNY